MKSYLNEICILNRDLLFIYLNVRKLNLIAIIIGIVVAIVVIYLLVFHTSSSTASATHTVTFEGQQLYKGSSSALVSSDGVSNFLIGTTSGLFLFNTETKENKKLNASIPSGLAYDGQVFMELQSDGTLYSVSLTDGSLVEIGTGYTRLYDTTDGYLIGIGSNTSVTGESGSSVPANGDYTTIKVSIT